MTFLVQTHIPPAVLWMQQMSRRFIARSAYIKTLREHVHTSVVVPASMLLQRTWWGHLAKKIANKKRMYRDNATEIQRYVAFRRSGFAPFLTRPLTRSLALTASYPFIVP